MKVKDVIIHALKLTDREDIAGSLAEGGPSAGEETEIVKTFLFCYNAVEDELSKNGFPLVEEEQFTSVSGRVSFSSFRAPVVRILGVQSDGRETAYTVSSLYLKAEATRFTVKYEHPPAKKSLTDDCEYGEEIGERVLAYGTAAEYCLINGEIKFAEYWESRYGAEIAALRRREASGAVIRDRRWV